MILTKSYEDLYVLHSDLEKSILSLCCHFPVRSFMDAINEYYLVPLVDNSSHIKK